MISRFFAACTFALGALLTWIIFQSAKAFGESIAGMSAGTIDRGPGDDRIVLGLFFTYFGLSGIGVVVAKTKKRVEVAALLAYSILLGAFIFIGRQVGFESEGQTVLALSGVYFLPWSIVWLLVWSRATRVRN